MQCLILAGGLGTRMHPVTEKIPKILLPVNGKPFAVAQLELLKRFGFQRLTYSIGFKGQQIRQALGDGSRWQLEIDYVDEGDELRGTGGAVRLALDQGALESTFCVLYGDSYLPFDYRAVWKHFQTRPEAALMTVFRNQGRFDTSNARLENGKVFYDKKRATQGAAFDFIDYGFSILRREAADLGIPADEKSDLADFFHRLSVENHLAGYEITERFYEVGSPQGLKDLETFLSRD